MFAVTTKELAYLTALLQIGIAYGTGYLAFNHFEYRERINSLLNEYLLKYAMKIHQLRGSAKNPDEVGPTLHFIAECFTDHKLQSPFGSFFYRQPPAIDKIIIFYLTTINVVVLCFVAIWGIEVPFSHYFVLWSFPTVTIVITSLLVLQLNRILHDYTSTLDLTYKMYLPYEGQGLASQVAEQRVSNNQALLALAVHWMKNPHDEHYEDVTHELRRRLRKAEGDEMTGDLLDHHALIRHVLKKVLS